MKKDEKFLQEMIDYYGIQNIPDPKHWPMRFEFLVKSFEHHKKMKPSETGVATKNDKH